MSCFIGLQSRVLINYVTAILRARIIKCSTNGNKTVVATCSMQSFCSGDSHVWCYLQSRFCNTGAYMLQAPTLHSACLSGEAATLWTESCVQAKTKNCFSKLRPSVLTSNLTCNSFVSRFPANILDKLCSKYFYICLIFHLSYSRFLSLNKERDSDSISCPIE